MTMNYTHIWSSDPTFTQGIPHPRMDGAPGPSRMRVQLGPIFPHADAPRLFQTAYEVPIYGWRQRRRAAA